MKESILVVITIILTAGIFHLISQQTEASSSEDWILSRQRSGVQVFHRSVPESRIKEIKGTILLKTPIEVVATVLRDLERYPSWMKGCKNISLLKKFDNNNMIIYYVQKMAWPLRTRAIVLRVKTQIKFDPIAFHIQMTSTSADPFNLSQKHMLMTNMKGKWTVSFISRNETRIIYQLYTDPGGSIPPGLINSYIKKFIYRALRGIKKAVKTEYYLESAKKSADRLIIEKLLEKDKIN